MCRWDETALIWCEWIKISIKSVYSTNQAISFHLKTFNEALWHFAEIPFYTTTCLCMHACTDVCQYRWPNTTHVQAQDCTLYSKHYSSNNSQFELNLYSSPTRPPLSISLALSLLSRVFVVHCTCNLSIRLHI